MTIFRRVAMRNPACLVYALASSSFTFLAYHVTQRNITHIPQTPTTKLNEWKFVSFNTPSINIDLAVVGCCG
jgi:hypothetical protein